MDEIIKDNLSPKKRKDKIDETKLIKMLLDVICEYDEIAKTFIEKVHSGRARSIETYETLSKALRLSKETRIKLEELINEIK
ncbi:MAG: hypothetical protein ACOCZ5_00570 [bacterium]